MAVYIVSYRNDGNLLESEDINCISSKAKPTYANTDNNEFCIENMYAYGNVREAQLGVT